MCDEAQGSQSTHVKCLQHVDPDHQPISCLPKSHLTSHAAGSLSTVVSDTSLRFPGVCGKGPEMASSPCHNFGPNDQSLHPHLEASLKLMGSIPKGCILRYNISERPQSVLLSSDHLGSLS